MMRAWLRNLLIIMAFLGFLAVLILPLIIIIHLFAPLPFGLPIIGVYWILFVVTLVTYLQKGWD